MSPLHRDRIFYRFWDGQSHEMKPQCIITMYTVHIYYMHSEAVFSWNHGIPESPNTHSMNLVPSH